MKSTLKRYGGGLLLLALLVVAVLAYGRLNASRTTVPEAQLVLVLPDDGSANTTQVQSWRDAAEELGLLLTARTASQVMRDGPRASGQALILPDAVHRNMGEVLVAHLTERVKAGDRLMLVHDAGVATLDGQYVGPRSRLSELAGVDYALYDDLQTGMLRPTKARVATEQIDALEVPPGKLMPETEVQETHAGVPGAASKDYPLVLSGYGYGHLAYTAFVTRGRFDGTPLMTDPDGGLLAGVHRVGKGEVLFVNLPLTVLKSRTDSLPLHMFLQYFARHVVGMPQLSAMPKGKGAVIMNWHVDDAKALPALQKADELGAFAQGPYSIHFTVGPDVNEPGDGKGMDLRNQPAAQQWMRRLAASGHEVGSHGGWIHNWFGAHVGDIPRDEATGFVTRNSAAVESVSRRPVREYSAPVGNHPAWLTSWLKTQGVRSYYFTGDSGMAPTRSYQDGLAPPTGIWAYPVLSFGVYASFEEAKADGATEEQVSDWLESVNDFCADKGAARLVYFHPFGIVMYPKAFTAWLSHAKKLIQQDRLSWMTMDSYTGFAERRLKVRWNLQSPATALPTGRRSRELIASHPDSLDGMTWLLPKSRFEQPTVVEGEASVQLSGQQWRVTAGRGKALRLALAPAVSTPQQSARFNP